MKRKTEITIETERRVVIGKPSRNLQAWCPVCSEQVTMLTADMAAKVARLSSRIIYRQIEADQLHFIERLDHQLLICANSLNRLLASKRLD